ncbi:hypothetical protein WDV06_30905 [Streptomyces racemochromogenes]|uniref:Integral membrane protein n=1 Tax=Streptomyces racemochromogenes TaxID=67353 RepID=A0ABW7PM42_9ACTN
MTENPLAGDAPARRAFVAPLVSTLLTLPLALAALGFAGLSPMACDACDTEAAQAFDASFQTAWTVFAAGLVGVLVLLVWCWALPWRVRNTARRVGLAFAAPALVVLDTVVFAALVDWP